LKKKYQQKKEFRLIVCDKRVALISQQKCYSKLKIKFEEEEVLKIVDFWNAMAGKSPYNDVVLDVYFNENNEPRLIECNPGGAWNASGSALFEWKEDFSKIEVNRRPRYAPKYSKQTLDIIH